MNLLFFLLLALGQLFTGAGLLMWIGIPLRMRLLLPLGLILGQGCYALLPFGLQLLHLPVRGWSVFLACSLLTLIAGINGGGALLRQWRGVRFRLLLPRLYEWPALLVIAFFFLLSAWRCFYYPPTPRDLTSGPEVIAEYAVKEGSLVNSVFSVDLATTNNQFKPPYLTSLQVIYKLAGFPFGQVWLSLLFLALLILLYQVLKESLHPLLAGLLLVLFLAVPEFYAYTYVPLFDLPNAVYFFAGVYFLVRFFDTERMRELLVSSLFLGLATYIRSETLLLLGLLWLAVLWHQVKNWQSGKRLLRTIPVFFLPALVLYLLSVTVYSHFYLPMTYEVSGLVNRDPLNLARLWERFAQMNTKLIFSEFGISCYGYFFFFFLVLFFTDFVFTDSWNLPARNWVFAVLVVYLGLPLIGHLLPLMDIMNSTKRGLFKLFPLMLLFFAQSGLLRHLSARLQHWEQGAPEGAEGEPAV